MQKQKCTAIVLAAGRGTRMKSEVQKQYLELSGKPIVYYSLNAFQQSPLIDDIIMVVEANQESYCKTEIVDRYQLTKVTGIVAGGAERYISVRNGLDKINHEGYVFIHDGARPFIDETILERAYEAVLEYKACTVGMPAKDTITIVDENGFAKETPDRSYVWAVQTPQIFSVPLIKEAHAKLKELEMTAPVVVTDDTMVLERMLGVRSKFVEGAYENIKITTPEDLDIANTFLKK